MGHLDGLVGTWMSSPAGAGHPWRVQGERAGVRSWHLVRRGHPHRLSSFVHPHVRMGGSLLGTGNELTVCPNILTLTGRRDAQEFHGTTTVRVK